MTHVVARLAFCLAGMHLALAAADRVIEDQTTETLIFRKLAVPVADFSHQYAVGRARAFLAENADRKVIRLTIVPDEKPANYRLGGCDHCTPYRFWRLHWDGVGTVPFPIAELMSIDGNAILRFRDGKGMVSVDVLQGTDPRAVHIGAFSGTIIHVGMQGTIRQPTLQLYAVGKGTIESKAGAQYAQEVAARLEVPGSSVMVRADPWFIGEIWKPFFPLFDANGPVPTEQEFSKTKTFDCFYFSQSNNHCSWNGELHLP